MPLTGPRRSIECGEYDLEDPDVLLRLFNEYNPEIEVSIEDFADGKVIVIC